MRAYGQLLSTLDDLRKQHGKFDKRMSEEAVFDQSIRVNTLAAKISELVTEALLISPDEFCDGIEQVPIFGYPLTETAPSRVEITKDQKICSEFSDKVRELARKELGVRVRSAPSASED